MSRKKGTVKQAAQDGLSNLQRWQPAQYGENYDSEASALVQTILEATLLESGKIVWPGCYNEHLRAKAVLERHRMAWNLITRSFSSAWDKGNGDVFRKVADIIDHQSKPADPVRAYIGQVLAIGDKPPKHSKIADHFKVTTKTVGRIRKEYGTKGNQGRPKKQDNS